jgi:hypothetical protein
MPRRRCSGTSAPNSHAAFDSIVRRVRGGGRPRSRAPAGPEKATRAPPRRCRLPPAACRGARRSSSKEMQNSPFPIVMKIYSVLSASVHREGQNMEGLGRGPSCFLKQAWALCEDFARSLFSHSTSRDGFEKANEYRFKFISKKPEPQRFQTCIRHVTVTVSTNRPRPRRPPQRHHAQLRVTKQQEDDSEPVSRSGAELT